MESKSVAVIALTVVSAIALILVFIFNALNSVGIQAGLFVSDVGNISDKYETDVTPAGYTFSIWAVIYIWQAAWMIYAVSAIFRTNSKGRVLLNPVVFPILFHVFWIASCVFNITWLFLWNREQLLAAFVILLLLTLTGYAATAFQAIATTENKEQIKKESRADLIMIYVLVQNGTDLIFSWTTVATMLNLSIFLTYSPHLASNMSRQSASTLALCILLVLVVGWSVVENTVFFKYFHFVYAWYAVLIWASAGILSKNYDASNPNTILTIVIMVVALICLVLKIGVYFYRTKRAEQGSQTQIGVSTTA